MKAKKTILISVFALLIIELILHILNPVYIQYGSYPAAIYQYDSVTPYYSYKPNTSFTVAGKKYKINKQGYIGEDFDINSCDTFRIAIVGASAVAGPNHILEYASFTFPLERIFKENNFAVNVFNCGIDGGNRTYPLLKSVDRVMNLNPDIIFFAIDMQLSIFHEGRYPYKDYLIFYPVNDTITLEKLKKKVDKLDKYERFLQIADMSYIIRAVTRYIANNYRNKFYVPLFDEIDCYQRRRCSDSKVSSTIEKLTVEESLGLYKKTKDRLATEHNIQFFLFHTSYDNGLYNICKENDLPLMQLEVQFDNNDYMYRDAHLNEKGCEKFANQFYQTIIQYELISDEYKKSI